MKCKDYNTLSVLCQSCEYPFNIKCCKNLTNEEKQAYSEGLKKISTPTGVKLYKEE